MSANSAEMKRLTGGRYMPPDVEARPVSKNPAEAAAPETGVTHVPSKAGMPSDIEERLKSKDPKVNPYTNKPVRGSKENPYTRNSEVAKAKAGEWCIHKGKPYQLKQVDIDWANGKRPALKSKSAASKSKSAASNPKPESTPRPESTTPYSSTVSVETKRLKSRRDVNDLKKQLTTNGQQFIQKEGSILVPSGVTEDGRRKYVRYIFPDGDYAKTDKDGKVFTVNYQDGKVNPFTSQSSITNALKDLR